MATRKWQSSSGASKNRILGATRLKSEGQTIFPVTLNDNSSNGFALNVQGSNLVLGLGTSSHLVDYLWEIILILVYLQQMIQVD